MTPLLADNGARAGAARGGEPIRHLPEQTLLYQLVEQYYPPFVEHLAAHERSFPAHVQLEFEDNLKCSLVEPARGCRALLTHRKAYTASKPPEQNQSESANASNVARCQEFS